MLTRKPYNFDLSVIVIQVQNQPMVLTRIISCNTISYGFEA